MAAAAVTNVRDAIAARLIAKMARTHGAPNWKNDNCMVFAADPLRDVLGFDPAARFRGRFSTPRGALRVLRREGFSDVLEACTSVAAALGWPRIDPVAAETGDPGLARVEGVYSFALLHPSGLWVCRSSNGYGCLPVNTIKAAWRCIQ